MIPFNRASFEGRELDYLSQAMRQGHTAGNGPFAKRAESVLSEMHGGSPSLLTTSGTHALELAARLLDLQPGDEVIVPSYTFVSTASSFIWNGAIPVFADVHPDTLNIDPVSAEMRITPRTRAICIVHYAGVGAEPERFADVARRHQIALIEDNAHGLGARYGGRTLGTFGDLSTLSFHETKNVTCGEGGALIVNSPALMDRAEILREKGTDRSKFMRGEVDKYTWVDTGSSWVMSDLLAAVLLGQLERFDHIQQRRHELWNFYTQSLGEWAEGNGIHMPVVPSEAQHSAHMFYLRLPSLASREHFISHLRTQGVHAVFHYQPLHSSPQGLMLRKTIQDCPHSATASDTVVRLPLYEGLTNAQQREVVEAVIRFSP